MLYKTSIERDFIPFLMLNYDFSSNAILLYFLFILDDSKLWWRFLVLQHDAYIHVFLFLSLIPIANLNAFEL